MTTKHYVEDGLHISESDNMVAVYVPDTVAGSADVAWFILNVPDEPYLRGEDYPALVKIWDNEEDAIYDNL